MRKGALKMPTYTVEQLMRELGQNATVSLTSHSEIQQTRKAKVGQVRGRSIDETKTLIKNCITEAGRPMTIAEICICLERAQTPHIRNILKVMAQTGELVEQADLARSRQMVRFWYSLP